MNLHTTKKPPIPIETILPSLVFEDVRKKSDPYQFSETVDGLVPMSYAVSKKEETVITTLPGREGLEVETKNVAHPGDIIMCGVSGERYVVKAEKFPKLYTGEIGKEIVPEQTPRTVARIPEYEVTAPWGEKMIARPGDLIVREADGKYYRIAAEEAKKTYETPPSEVMGRSTAAPEGKADGGRGGF